MRQDTYRHHALAFLSAVTEGELTGIRFGLPDGETLLITIPTADVPMVLDRVGNAVAGKAKVGSAVVKPTSTWKIGHTARSGHVIIKFEGEVPRAVEASDVPGLIADLQTSLQKVLGSAS